MQARFPKEGMNFSKDTLSRRDFLKNIAVAASGFAVFGQSRKGKSQEFPVREAESTWQVTTAEDVQRLLTSPEFLEQMLVGQYDQTQYQRGLADFYKNNACHVSTMLMVKRFCQLLKSGQVSEETIGVVLSQFIGKTYSTSSGEHLYIHDAFGTMHAYGLARAFRETDPAQELYRVVEGEGLPLSHPDDEETRYLDFEHIQPLLDFGQTIFSEGGVLVVLGLNYGRNGTGSGGHFALVSALRRDSETGQVMATIIDPMHQGHVFTDIPWRNFWENSWDGKINTPIMGVFGVIPTLGLPTS